MLTLSFFHDSQLLKELTLSPGESCTVGRKGKGADVEIDNAFVSSKHLMIEVRADGSAWLTDTNSANGTFSHNRSQKLEAQKAYPISNADTFWLTINANISLKCKLVQSSHTQIPHSPPPQVPRPHAQHAIPTNLIEIIENERDNELTIGRGNDNDLVLPHPTVSRNHAKINKLGANNYVITDLGARNGTYINGIELKGSKSLVLEDVINIGPYEFRLLTPKDDVLSTRINTTAAIVATDLVTTVRGGKEILNLRGVTVPIPEGEMIALMGPSGCGKSTLMNALNGNFPSDADKGSVKILGFELNQRNFTYLKQFIGFVPQDDIVHRELTVQQCMWYAAKLKLPDATDQDRIQRIGEVMADLRISDKHIEGISQKMVRELSGGQRKRVSIAIELLSKPSVLFLDEPTSPLDPQTIDEFLICLKDLTKGKNGQIGTTIVMVTHKPDDLFHMDKIIFMATGGFLTYYGDINGYKSYFGVQEVKHIYGSIDSKSKGEKLTEKWKKSPEKQVLERTYTSQKEKQNVSKPNEDNALRQMYWLARRYMSIKTNDQANTLLMLLQAPIIAGLMCIIFDSLNIGVLFMTAVSAIWFGTNNAGREIVGELAIYLRERMFNVRIMPYLFSKMLVLSIFSIIQVSIFVTIVSLRFDLGNIPQNILVMFLITFASTMMGLFVSAVVKTNEQVMTIIPIILIPQILLSGVLDRVEGPTEVMSRITVSRWGTESFAHLTGDIPTEMDSVCRVPEHTFYKEYYEKDKHPATLPLPPKPKVPDRDTIKIDDHKMISELNMPDEKKTEKWYEGIIYISIMALIFFIATFFSLRSKDPFRKLRK